MGKQKTLIRNERLGRCRHSFSILPTLGLGRTRKRVLAGCSAKPLFSITRDIPQQHGQGWLLYFLSENPTDSKGQFFYIPKISGLLGSIVVGLQFFQLAKRTEV